VVINLASATKARFVQIRPKVAVGGLRVCAFAQDGRVTVNVDREFGEADIQKLTKAGWSTERAGGEDLSPSLLEAEAILQAMSAKQPSPFPLTKASSGASGKTAKSSAQSALAAVLSKKPSSRR
jgi:hypothetical protein